MIEKEVYFHYRDTDAAIKVKLSIIHTKKSWFFVALKGDKYGSPRWYFINQEETIYSEFAEICQQLRYNLVDVNDREVKWDETVVPYLEKYLECLNRNQINILPHRRKRALKVAQDILESQKNKSEKAKEGQKTDLLEEILKLFKPISSDEESTLDYYHFSQQWLDILTPYLHKYKMRAGKKKLHL